jgi:hypothetical protein
MAQPPGKSKVNKRDAAKDAVTSETQSNRQADLDLTRNIRRDITGDKDMSMYAKTSRSSPATVPSPSVAR